MKHFYSTISVHAVKSLCRFVSLMLGRIVAVLATIAPTALAAQVLGTPTGAYTITLADNTPINGPIALTPGLTLKVTYSINSSSIPNYTPLWGWVRNLNGDVNGIGTANSQTLAITQAGRYSVRDNTSPVACTCMYQEVEVFDTPALRGQPATYATKTTVLKPGTTAGQVATLRLAERLRTSSAVDGFGRTVQTVQRQATPDLADLVSFQEYDAYGQASTSYLPYSRTSNSSAPPFTNDAVSEQQDFYTATPQVAADIHPSGVLTTEASPLARPVQQTRPGDDWQGHPSVQSYASNAASEVRKWGEDLLGNNFYPAHALTKETHENEDGHRTEIFRDQLGQVVLQRQWNGQTSHDTYTVYNAAGQVRYVIPPAAVEETAPFNYNASLSIFKDRWLYEYAYDDSGRLISRTFPGAEPVEMVYDRFDRLILTQDGNARRDGRWLFTKVDALGRPVVEGLFYSGSSRATLQNAADNWTGAAYEQRIATGIGYTTTGSYPQVTDGVTGHALTTTFYDDYDLNLDANATADFTYRSQGLGTDEPIPTDRTNGRVTATRRRIVGPGGNYGDWLTTVNFYDTYGNVIQTQKNSHMDLTGLPNVTTLVYREHGFVPQILRSIKAHTERGVEVHNRFTYGAAGHLLQVWQQNVWPVKSEPEVLVASYAYNTLGQLIEKNLHSSDNGNTFLQSVDFRYDIQGSLKSINNSALVSDYGESNDDDNDVFGLQLVRQAQNNEVANTPRFDGGISAVRWQSHNGRQQHQPELERSYVFAYDGLARLTDASYKARDPRSGSFQREVGAYDEKDITYDANGNIRTLTRNTQPKDDDGLQTEIDRLTYAYDGNRLTAVDDAANPAVGFRDGAGTDEYQYDRNGNVVEERNRGLGLTYNALNKVDVQKAKTGNTTYAYDAAGTVLRRVVTGATEQTFDYVDGFVYTTSPTYDGLLSVPTPEGRAVVLTTAAEPSSAGPTKSTSPRLVYEYHMRDHLGNLRVAFRAEKFQQQVTLQMENPATEEGPYPAFGNVASTQSTNYAYEGTKSAAVTASNPGPFTRLPVETGDAVKVDFFYLTPTTVVVQPQYSARTTPKPARWAPTAALAPVLLAAPTNGREAAGGAPRPGIGLQLSLSGLLSRTIKPAAPTEEQQLGGVVVINPSGPYVRWTLFDANEEVIDNGVSVVPLMPNGSGTPQWSHFTTSIAVNPNTAGQGHLEVQLLNGSSAPIYYDSVTIRHPRTELVVSQENHYYPFGMNMKGVAVNTLPAEAISKAQFNGGSELQDELLDDESGIYSTPYRTYDPTIGRFQGIDPIAGKYAVCSPYNFAFNDPANINDPTGAAPPLTPGAMLLAMNLYASTSEGGSSFWSPTLGGTFNDASTTMQLLQAGAYNELGGGVAQFSGGMVTAQFGDFIDNHGTVSAHNVNFNSSITILGSPANFLIQHMNTVEAWYKSMTSFEHDENIDMAINGVSSIGDVIDVANSHAILQVVGKSPYSIVKSGVKAGRLIGRVGIALSIADALYDVATGEANTHTLVDLGVSLGFVAAGIILSPAAAPALAIGALAYGIWSASVGDDLIDKHFPMEKLNKSFSK